MPATPERLWEAVATTEGNAAWLFPNEIDPSGAGATAWDPPHHFAIRQEQGPPPSASPNGFKRLRQALGLDEQGHGR
ncbi:MAG: hypothetical protein WBP81_12945 [Solirubrobacteraceae bacterium]